MFALPNLGYDFANQPNNTKCPFKTTPYKGVAILISYCQLTCVKLQWVVVEGDHH